jgi:D-amino-acid oxidase
MKIAVVGGGVIGLSVAHRLVQRGCRVTVFSPQSIDQLTSAVAAAYWGPVWIGDYDRNWAITTLTEFQRLAERRVPGVTKVEFDKWLTSDAAGSIESGNEDAHWWRHLPGIDFRVKPLPPKTTLCVDDQELTFTTRIRFRSIVARMPDYLRWLESELTASGQAVIEKRWVDSLDEVTGGTGQNEGFDHTVNCSGAGAKALCGHDPATMSMKLLAGHAVLTQAPEIRHARLFAGGTFVGNPVYVVPRDGSISDVLVGGTAIEVTEPINFRKLISFQREERCPAVMARARQCVPELDDCVVQSQLVGLRPVRSSVRIERDADCHKLIHCYGHGGSGMTLSWGSADRVCELIGV